MPQPVQPSTQQAPQAPQKFKRKQIYLNMDMQFKYSLVLIFTMFVEMVIVGLAMLFVLSQPKPDIPGANIYFIYRVVLAIIVFMTLCNIMVGLYLSHKVAGPLFRFVMCSREVANGNLRIQVNLRKGDELRELEGSFNEMTEKLRAYVREDRKRIEEIVAAADVIGAEVKNGKVQEAVETIKSRSKQIHSHVTI